MRKYILTEDELEDLLLYKVKLSAYVGGRALNYCYIDEAIENSPDWDAENDCWNVEDYFDLYEQVDDGEDESNSENEQ
jgi:hypothetical protein